MDQEIAKKVTDILINKIGLTESELTDDASFIRDLSIDSLDIAELVMEFEKTFDIKIPDSDTPKLSNLRHVVEYIQSKIKEKG
jgi:acyl carrier protein